MPKLGFILLLHACSQNSLSLLYFCGVFPGFTVFRGIQLGCLVVIFLSLNQNHSLCVKKYIQLPDELSALYSIISKSFLSVINIRTLQPFSLLLRLCHGHEHCYINPLESTFIFVLCCFMHLSECPNGHNEDRIQ